MDIRFAIPILSQQAHIQLFGCTDGHFQWLRPGSHKVWVPKRQRSRAWPWSAQVSSLPS